MKSTRVSARTFLSVPAVLSAVAGLAALTPSALANLGSFAPNDGYSLSVYSGSYNWCDVAYYNAGQYGINSGGGPGPNLMAPNSSNWTITSQAGGFFGNAAARAATVGTAPPYPTSNPLGVGAYIVGDHGPGRTDNSSLAVRNDTALGTVGALRYEYDMDTYDTGGPVAASVTSGSVSYGIYMAASPSQPVIPGQRVGQKFHQSLMDSSGNVGLEWGYARDNEIIWRDSPSNPWNYSGLYTNGAWDGISATIDLTADTFALSFYDATTFVTTVLAAPGTPLGTPMGNFTTLSWQLEDGVQGGLGGKNFFDDANFNIPAPGAVALLGLGALVGARRRR